MKQEIVGAYLVLENGVVKKNLVIEGDRIASITDHVDSSCLIVEAEGKYVFPGFVDIHCHAGGGYWVQDEPQRVADFHLRHGTTTLFPTIAYTVGFDDTLKGIDRIIQASNTSTGSNIKGINMEGPYINMKYGMASWNARKVDRKEYEQIVECGKGFIRLWTVAPELDGEREFIDYLNGKNIVVAVGHSEAPGELVMELASNRKIRLATHTMDATGCARTICAGTREFGIDEAVMLSDDLYAEIISDSKGMHVRGHMLQLLLKVKGEEHLILITDATEFSDVDPGSDSDLFFNEYGQLAGSRLTMDAAVRNMRKHVNADLPVISKMASGNPARLLGVDDEVGCIQIGKKADLVVTNDDIRIQDVFMNGSRLRMN
ncbi:MAG: amidohydrolase family protein [Spirochaetaceae bacterium]|nr:amidohydrolase family protein [Spirochaetaceae bacterium]